VVITPAGGSAGSPSLASTFGQALGAEARTKGDDVLLASGCNLVRVPQCGRAFEAAVTEGGAGAGGVQQGQRQSRHQPHGS
jgi:beta-glucosidase